MSWFLKRSGMNRQEEARWQLRLKLTRWRHFLAAEHDCLALLADLREKLNGEYVFDRQFIHSTLGQLFQSAYQMAHDRGILEQSNDADMLFWLDRIREQAHAYVAGFSSSGNVTTQVSGKERILDFRKPDLEEWWEEPEFQMIRGAVDLLDPRELPQPDAAVPGHGARLPFRKGLQLAHEMALLNLEECKSLKDWSRDGVAYASGEIRPFSFWVIDVRPKADVAIRGAPALDLGVCQGWHCMPWLPIRDGIASTAGAEESQQGSQTTPLLLVIGEDALFLTGTTAAGRIILDVVLTADRKWNHWFLRWDGSTGIARSRHLLAGFFHSACHETGGACEDLQFHQTGDDIAGQLRKLGAALAFNERGTDP